MAEAEEIISNWLKRLSNSQFETVITHWVNLGSSQELYDSLSRCVDEAVKEG